MKTDIVAVRESERLAMSLLTVPFMSCAPNIANALRGDMVQRIYPNYAHMVNPMSYYTGNDFMTEPRLVTMPGTLQQELPYTDTGNYEFNFASNGSPAATAALNNITLAQNNVAAIYGMRLRIGYGAEAVTRHYLTYGQTLPDNSIYNSLVKLTVESENQVSNFSGDDFKDVPINNPNTIDKYNGFMLTNPIRLVSGKIGVFTVSIKTISPSAGLEITPNAFLSVTLFIAYGQASGGPAPKLTPPAQA